MDSETEEGEEDARDDGPRDESEEQAWEALRAAGEAKTPAVRLAGLGLERLPSRLLGGLTHVEELDLGGNVLTSLAPESLAACGGSLQSLILAGNRLCRLPISICCCTQLEVLDCSSNSLSGLPEGLGILVALRVLNCAGNGLKELPVGLGDLQRLTRLVVAGNALEGLPGCLGSLSALAELDCSENRLTALPETLADLARLKELKAQGNPFTDKKLQKAADGGSLKQVMQLLRGGLSKTQVKRRGRGAGREADEETEDPSGRLLPPDPSGLRRVVLRSSAEGVRPFLCCCVLHLGAKDGPGIGEAALRGLIDAQQELHRGPGDHRRVAAIGTHDLDLGGAAGVEGVREVAWPLELAAERPSDVRFRPLVEPRAGGADGPEQACACEAWALPSLLCAWDADSRYKAYARRACAGVRVALLRDAAGEVLSIYPVSNCRATQNTAGMRRFLLEVTSSVDIKVCKEICSELICRTVGLVEGADGEACGGGPVYVEAVQVVDEGGRPRCRFPLPEDLERTPPLP